MFEIRKPKFSPIGLMDCAMFVRGRECRSGSSVSLRVILAMSGPWVGEFRKCGSITAPGYRIYFTRIEREIVVLLAGGDKRTQSADIKTALSLARNL